MKNGNRSVTQIEIRGRPHLGRRGVVQCGQGGSSDADVRTFWCKKLRIFRNLWCPLAILR